MSEITVFEARKVLTMDHNRPEATHVAVRDGVVLAAGGADCAAGWGPARRDDRFRDAVILPGLIEAHAHAAAGGVWRYLHVGPYPRTDPEGRAAPGARTAAEVVAALRVRAAETPGDGPVIGWGFDPNALEGPPLTRAELDAASDARPVVVLHSNFHLLTANTAALALAGMAEGSNLPGVMRDGAGRPTGELREFEAMGPVLEATGVSISALVDDAASVRAYGRVCRSCGVTTVAELLSDLDPPEVAMLEEVTADPAFPTGYVPIMNAMRGDPEDEARRAVALAARSTDKLSLGRAKLFTDGAIQGFTAKLLPPGYYAGEDHGLWNMEPGHFRAAVAALHAHGVKTHIHTNGDAATALAMDAYEDAYRRHGRGGGLRHTLEHSQLADRAQFRRMRNLGLCVNLFANHVHYFGDVHRTRTLGPDRAARMDACADAAAVFGADGFAIHSDAPVTPMAPLFTAWVAVNRLTQSGFTLGESQKISVADALRCVTLGAAHVLKLDHVVGSLAPGRRADFCVLEEDPLAVDPLFLKDIPVRATVLGGVPTEAA